MLKESDKFGSYRAVKSLGRGGMGEVWLLQHEANGCLFAVKILTTDCETHSDSRKRFLREAQLAMSVNHANLVKVFDVGEDPDSELCYILMEYVSGGTLRDRIKSQGCMSIKDALKIVRGIASVLEETQTRKIVHRDIKPDNILFTTDGVPKLSDLGIARVRTDKTLTTVTVDGSVIGTPVYMAPEQMLDSHHVDVRADIYSLGIVLFEMLAGRRPWQDEGIVQMMARAVQHKEIIDIRNFRRSVPEAISNLIRRMCAAKVDQRIASPRQIVNICNSLLGEKQKAPGISNLTISTSAKRIQGAATTVAKHTVQPTKRMATQASRPSTVRRTKQSISIRDFQESEPAKRNPLPWIIVGVIVLFIILIMCT